MNVKISLDSGITTMTSLAEVNVPIPQVWAVVGSLGNVSQFHPLIKESIMTSDQQAGIGATRRCNLLPFGQMDEKVIEWADGKSFTMEVIGGKMLPPLHFMRGKLSLVEVNEKRTGIVFQLTYQLKYGFIGRLMDTAFVRRNFKKAPFKYVNGLKVYIEKLNN